MTAAFTVGTAYPARFPTSADLAPLWTVLSRTARFITVRQEADGSIKRVGVKTCPMGGGEYALPYGAFSMAPAIKAERPAAATSTI